MKRRERCTSISRNCSANNKDAAGKLTKTGIAGGRLRK